MARGAENFRALRGSLHTSLSQEARIPEFLDDRDVARKKKGQRFFPDGSAQKVFTTNKLERLFTLVTAAAPNLTLSPQWLAQEAERRKMHTFLAILVDSNCDLDALVSFTRKMASNGEPIRSLPIEDHIYLTRLFGDEAVASSFHRNQYDFLAHVIVKNKDTKGHHHRLPYLSEQLIGEGSFGKVYKVVIPPRHFRSGQTSNDHDLTLARKDFVLHAGNRAHENERTVLWDIIRNVKKNDNIMESLGSLEVDLTYSIFMPLAICDLDQYMEQHPTASSQPTQKAALVKRAIGLAGAVVFLHEELESPVYEKLSCFHMDLKPQNILVVNDEESGQQLWKLSDFNMSRIKMKRKPRDQPPSLPRASTLSDVDINKLFRRRIPDNTSSVGEPTINRRGAGTYLAPEACIEGHAVQAESDTWSLGCVLSVVFTYLYGGNPAVKLFSNHRLAKSRDRSDRFFTSPTNRNPQTPGDCKLNDGVKSWLRELQKQRNSTEEAMMKTLMRFFEKEVLTIDPSRRRQTTAKRVREKLIGAFKVYSGLDIPDDGIDLPTSPTSRSRLSRFVSHIRRPAPDSTVRSLGQGISSETAITSSVFGPDARPLVCISGRNIVAYAVHQITTADDMDNLIPSGTVSLTDRERSWSKNIGVSAQCVLAATDHEAFECYFYEISRPGSALSELELLVRWSLPLPKIIRLAISPDSTHAAFVLQGDPADTGRAVLYIARLEFLPSMQITRSRNQSILSSSSGSSSNPEHPLGRAIPLSCPAQDVCDLTFSRVNGLYVITKPRHVTDATQNIMTISAWSLQEGRRVALQSAKIKHPGTADLYHGLFTSFAPYNRTPAFAVASDQNSIIARAWTGTPITQYSVPGFNVLHLLLDLNDATLLAFGVNQTNNMLHILAITGWRSQAGGSIRTLATLPEVTRENISSAAITASPTEHLAQRFVLITILDGNFLKLIRVPLDPI